MLKKNTKTKQPTLLPTKNCHSFEVPVTTVPERRKVPRSKTLGKWYLGFWIFFTNLFLTIINLHFIHLWFFISFGYLFSFSNRREINFNFSLFLVFYSLSLDNFISSFDPLSLVVASSFHILVIFAWSFIFGAWFFVICYLHLILYHW